MRIIEIAVWHTIEVGNASIFKGCRGWGQWSVLCVVVAVLVALLQRDHSLQDAPSDPVAGAIRSLDLDGVLWIRDGNEPQEHGVSIDAQFIAPPLDDGTKVNSSRRSDDWLDPLSGPWLEQSVGFPHEIAHERLAAAFAEGKLTKKSLDFLRSGKILAQKLRN